MKIEFVNGNTIELLNYNGEIIKSSKQIIKPKCYIPNNNTYPLCKGNNKLLYVCKNCCLYEDMEEMEEI